MVKYGGSVSDVGIDVEDEEHGVADREDAEGAVVDVIDDRRYGTEGAYDE